MFEPAKLSPLPWTLEEWADDVFDIDNVADNMAKDDAEFFVAARRCYDIGERRGWHLTSLLAGRFSWAVEFYYDDRKRVLEDHRAFVPTQAEAMELMIAADEWLTKQETSEGNSDEC